MLETPDVALLAAVAIEFSLFGIYNRILLRRQDARVQKYRLYAVRDDLTYLVATDKLAEGEELFQLFYGMTNRLIITTKQAISLRTFVSALTTAQANPADESELNRILFHVKEKDPAVQKVVHSFYSAVVEILLENSFLLRIGLRLTAVLKSTAQQLQASIESLLPHSDTYKIFRQYNRASQLLA